MRRVIFIAALLVVLCLPGLSTNAGRVAGPVPQNLQSYVGKYPSALLKDVPSVKRRLRVVLGANYSFFMARMQTEMPIENVEGCLVAVGCMAHSCGSEDAVMVINLGNGKMHCAIRSNKFNGGYRVYSEDKQNIPHALYHAMEQY
jgi:hypothetical protein